MVVIYTSYFANWRKFPKELKQVSIANFAPKGFSGYSYPPLYPSVSLLERYKQGLVSSEEFTEEYKEQLSKLDRDTIKEALSGCLLLCYEKKGDFCHRHIVAEWLEIGEL